MSKHANGNLSAFLYLRMRLAGSRMVLANARASKATDRYQALYFQRYGQPTIRQQLDFNENYYGCHACGKEAIDKDGKPWCHECKHDRHLAWLNQAGEYA